MNFGAQKGDVTDMTERADEIARLLAAAYGERDSRTIRAQEAHAAALQRFQRHIDRQDGATT